MKRDEEGRIFDSDIDYLTNSKDSIWYKALVYIYLKKGYAEEFTVESKDYYETMDMLRDLGILKSKNYKSMIPFIIFVFYCWDRLNILKYTSFKELNEDTILHFKNTEILKKTAQKIEPDKAFRQQIMEERGREILRILDLADTKKP